MALFANSLSLRAEGTLEFNEELAFELPAGWQNTLLDLAPPAPEDKGFDQPNLVVPLLQAHPADSTRTAQMTVYRDYTIDSMFGELGKNANLRRLHEIVTLKGYRVEKFTDRSSPEPGVEYATLGEVTALSPKGHRRVFAMLVFKQMHDYDVRCHWEFDQSDVLARGEFENWLNTLTSRGVNIADALDGRARLIGTGDVSQSGRMVNNPALPEPKPALPAVPDAPAASSEEKSQPALAGVSPSPSPLPSDVLSDQTRELVEKSRNALVVIEGTNGRGSGFVCNMDGKPTALTNAHVLAGNPQPRFTTMDGTVLNLGEAFLGVDHDVCKISTPGAGLVLELMSEADGVPKIGDAIAVLGNSEGAGVIKPLEGRIVGMGPNLIEVDAPFVPGNSGSPIIHLESGKVIGIATYLIIRKVNETDPKGTESSVRRFGYRLDSVKNWEAVNWPRFYAQAAKAEEIVNVGEEFAELLAFFRKKKGVMPQLGNNAIRRAVRTFEERLSSGRRMSEADMAAARREFLGNLRSATRSDLATFDTRTAYDYFRRQIADETKFRDALYEAFSKAIESNR